MRWNWPDNKRIALCLSFDIDAETLWLTRNEICLLYTSDAADEL